MKTIVGIGLIAILLLSFGSIAIAENETVSYLAKGELSINGTVFNDLNADGFRSVDEPGLPGWTINLMIDGEKVDQNTTSRSGQYSFENLAPGKYNVREDLQKGWTQSSPGGGSYEINLADIDAFNYDFGNYNRSIAITEMGLLKATRFGSINITQYPIMPVNAWQDHSMGVKRQRAAEAAKAVNLSETAAVSSEVQPSYQESFSLLSYVPYDPNERNQGNCGNCWIWGCTAPIEVAHWLQNGVKDRLSIQFANSNYNGGTGGSCCCWACCGGWEGAFADFYGSQGKFIPWANSNADFRDGGKECCSDPTSVPSNSISATPNYSITSIEWHPIETMNIAQDQAINNIKAVLSQNKAVTLGFALPDFRPFFAFWQYDSGIWDPDPYCGLSFNSEYGGGHLVTVVGYNDSDPADRYWIALNSWSNNTAHPDGTYKIKMDMNYNCSIEDKGRLYSSYDFGYFDVVFEDTVNCCENCTSKCPKCEELPENLKKYCSVITKACLDDCSDECGGNCSIP